MIRKISVPALVIHGEFDTLVPLQEGRGLFVTLGSTKKELVIIPRADHNNIMFVALEQYFGVIQNFMEDRK